MKQQGKTDGMTRTTVVFLLLALCFAGLVWLLHIRPAADQLMDQQERRRGLESAIQRERRNRQHHEILDEALDQDPQTVESQLRRLGYSMGGEWSPR